MACFAIKYQLNNAKDYQTLWDELARLNAQKVSHSFWFLDLDLETAVSVRDHFLGYVDTDDTLCVVPMLSRPSAYKCHTGTKDWLDQRF